MVTFVGCEIVNISHDQSCIHVSSPFFVFRPIHHEFPQMHQQTDKL